MRSAVIGGGNIGGTLGAAWIRSGHSAVYGSRNPQPPDSVAIADAVADAEVVLLAIPGAAVDEFASATGAALDGKLVIDATNRIGDDTMNGSAAIAQHAPGARYVRAFNSVGWEVMAEPGEATLFWAGPDDDAIERLVEDVGFRGVRVGDADMADVVDGVGRLWLTLVFRSGYPRHIAFKLLGA
jgi:predicted dinucleotide-binding enzyme